DMTPGTDEIQTDCSCDQSCPTYNADLSGATTICNGSSADITFNFSNGTAPYDVNWTGGSLSGLFDGHVETVSPSTTTTYAISSAIDANSCAATPGSSVTITVIDVIDLGSVSGSTSVCDNQSTNYTVSPVAGVLSYNWNVPTGATIISGQGTTNITIDWNGANSGDVCVDAENTCGAGTQSCQTVTVTPVVGQPGPISGPMDACSSDQLDYSIVDVPDASSYNWTVPANATLLSGQGTTDVVVRWNTAGSGDVCVRAQNSCGNSAYTCLTVNTTAAPTNPVFLPGNFAPCESSTLNYGVTPQVSFDDYQWTYDNGGDITAGQGTPNITVDWLGAGDGQLCVTATSSLCNVDRTACKSVVVQPLPPAPEYISYDDILCTGDTGIYVLDPIPGVTSYNWVAPGGEFIGSQTASTVNIKWPNPTFTTMEVSANNLCGTGPVNNNPTIVVSERPAIPGNINGPGTVCQSGSQTYSISAVPGADSYVWTVPYGASIQSGQGTVSVMIKFDSLGPSTICVRAKKGYCESMVSCKTVNVEPSVAVPGTINGPAEVCQTSTVIYSIEPVLGATSCAWTLPVQPLEVEIIQTVSR
ncbi:MAG: hypothetical protein R3D58_03915, partial [Saprospiraceae bacterium]